jgi:hypothetical protein
MSTQTLTQQVRWQDLTVMSEIDIVLEIARRQNWKDYEIFGHGDMITQPQDLKGWKLIPADQYEYSIPAEAVSRVHQLINAGVRIQGVIIADDLRREIPARTPVTTPVPAPVLALTPARPKVSLQPIKKALSSVGKTLLGLILIAGVIAVVGLIVVSLVALIKVMPWLLLLAPLLLLGGGAGYAYAYDPKLIILVDDGSGGTVWVSLFTWFD